ncbi:MAG: hypothetical protein IJ415_01130 [Clostridia bacterium]|nr:hypothetical protein [Clostridia bacterium]
MNWKNRLTNYNFWISMFSAVLLILQALKIEFDVAYVNEIFTAVLGLLVVVGIIIDPTKTATKSTQTEKETVETQSKKEIVENITETALPIEEKNEINNNNNENDIQTIMNKIASDLELKIKELDAINKDTSNKLVELNKTEQKNVDSQPAVAEMENPYIDLMK